MRPAFARAGRLAASCQPDYLNGKGEGYKQTNIDNLGENRDNRRGSDEVDERTAREIESEKPAVRERYEGTLQWLKAPNGKDTNLTEDQWLAARTKGLSSELCKKVQPT